MSESTHWDGIERRTAVRLPVTVAAFVAALVYVVVLPSASPKDAFTKVFASPDTTLWCVLIAAQVALWSYLGTPAYRRICPYTGTLRRHAGSVAADFAALALLVSVFWFGHSIIDASLTLPVAEQKEKVLLLNLLGFATIAPCLMGLRLVALAARAERARDIDAAVLERFAKLKADLTWFLAAASTIIAAATFANGALRNAINAQNGDQLPPTEVLLYGGFCSAIVALFYLPSHDAFRRSAQAVIDAAASTDAATPAAWAEAQERKAKLAGILGLSGSGLRALRDGSVILTPLMGSAATLLLP